MTDELIKRLRGWRGFHQANLSIEAADRIEQLTAERDKYESAWMTAEGRLADTEAERDRLRASIMFWLEAEEPDVDAAINMMRAALKGESHE